MPIILAAFVAGIVLVALATAASKGESNCLAMLASEYAAKTGSEQQAVLALLNQALASKNKTTVETMADNLKAHGVNPYCFEAVAVNHGIKIGFSEDR